MSKQSIVFLLGAFTLFAVLSFVLSSLEAFEWLREFSREHEEWDLDEIIISFFTAMFVAVFMLSIVTFRNLQALRRETLLRQQFEREAVATRHLRALGTLAGGLAHSANNFLQPIMTLTRMTRDDLPEGSDLRENMNRVLQSGAGASELFRNVLSFSHPVANTEGGVRVAAAMEQMRSILEIAIHEKAILTTSVEADFDTKLSMTNLTDILLVLVRNASDALRGERGTISITSFEEGELQRIRVQDDGHGMSDLELERAFDPFYTTKAVGEGSGLGLSIVRSMVEQVGGKIELESRPGSGTIVSISFPR